MSSRGVSVVPRIVLPSHGTANSTRPSSVFGTSSACVPGRNERSTTRCTPWLGATMPGFFARTGIAVHVADVIDPDAGGIDDALGGDAQLGAADRVARVDADDLAAFAHQRRHRAMVEHDRALAGRGARERDRQPRIVELPVPVLDAAGQAAHLHVGQQLARARGRQELGVAQAARAGERVVHLQPDAIERRFPDLVRRHHEGQRLRQMRRVGQQRRALVQRLAHQRHIALREIAHAAVHELGRARTRAFRKVLGFEQHDREAARRGVERDAAAGGAAADDGEVERAAGLRCHQRCLRSKVRLNARAPRPSERRGSGFAGPLALPPWGGASKAFRGIT